MKLLQKMIEKITKLLIKYCEKRGRFFMITGGPDQDTVYLLRYIVFKSKRFGCIYIHRFMRSDADTPHDHPWNFFTYIVSGGYTEKFYDKKQPQVNGDEFKSLWTEKITRREPGSLAYRKSTDIHKVEVDEEIELKVGELDKEKIERAPLTVCIMGPRLRHWGFWISSSVFTDWRAYLDIKPNDPRVEGSE